MVDQRFHRLLHLGALGREHLAVERRHRAFRHRVEALLHDPRRLADLLDPHHEAVVAVALVPTGHVELHLVVDFVGLALAQIPGQAGGADHRPREPQASASSFDTVAMSTLRCLKIRLSATREIESSNSPGSRLSTQSAMSASSFTGRSSRTLPGRNQLAHARARCPFVEVHQIFAQLEQPQVRRHRADVHDVAAEVEQMVGDAGQLGEQHAQILGAQRHLEMEQPIASTKLCSGTSARRNRAGPCRAASR